MIDNATLKVLHRQVTDLLLKYQLAEGLEGIGLVTRECSDQQLSRSLESLRLSYFQMLDFLEQGGKDAQRSLIQDNLQREAFRILNGAARQIRIERTEDYYGKAYRRLYLSLGDSATSVLRSEWSRQQGTAERYDTQDLLFDLLWTMPLWDAKDTADWFEFISRQDDLVQQHFTGAVFLSCWEYLDTEKITFLRLMADSENEEVHSLSMTLLTLVLLRFERQLSVLPPLPLNLHSKRINDTFCRIQRELILMRESPRANQKMNEAIKELGAKGGENMEEEMKLSMKKMAEFVSAGFDMDLAKVSLLHSSKFLRTISHWWVPFDESMPFIQEFFTRNDGNLAEGIRTLIGRSTECSLNRYALCELLSEHFDLGKIEDQLTPLFEAMGRLSEIKPQSGLSIRNHVQNLYRFFYHSPMSKEVENPFEASLMLPDNHYLRARFSKKHILELCDLLSAMNDTETALRYLQETISQDGATAKVLRMMGYCYEMQKDPRRAAQMYSQADMLEEDDKWTLTHLARCYQQTDQLPQLVEVLRRLEVLSPDDVGITLQIADSLTRMNRLHEALNQLYKAELAQPDNADTTSRIMVCSARLGKFEVTDKYLARRLLSDIPWDAPTHLAAGDAHLLKNEWKQAVEHYCQAGKENFKRHLQQILSLGITEKDLSLIKDMVERR